MRRQTAILMSALLLSGTAASQSLERPSMGPSASFSAPQTRRNNDAREIRALFDRIQRSITSGSVEGLLTDLAPYVDINIVGEEPGRYSSNQAASILSRFFLARKPLAFSFSSVADAVPLPYAIGPLSTIQRGNRETAQVYVSLRRIGPRWRIAQLNIY